MVLPVVLHIAVADGVVALDDRRPASAGVELNMTEIAPQGCQLGTQISTDSLDEGHARISHEAGDLLVLVKRAVGTELAQGLAGGHTGAESGQAFALEKGEYTLR